MTKFIITNHHQEFRRDIGVDCTSPQLTEQSDEQIELTKEQQKTQKTQQQLNTAQTAKSQTEQQIAEAEREDIQNTTDARTVEVARWSSAGGGR